MIFFPWLNNKSATYLGVGFLGGLVEKNPPVIKRHRLEPWVRKKENEMAGEGNGNPLQYCCVGHPMDRGSWWATVPGVTKSQT